MISIVYFLQVPFKWKKKWTSDTVTIIIWSVLNIFFFFNKICFLKQNDTCLNACTNHRNDCTKLRRFIQGYNLKEYNKLRYMIDTHFVNIVFIFWFYYCELLDIFVNLNKRAYEFRYMCICVWFCVW